MAFSLPSFAGVILTTNRSLRDEIERERENTAKPQKNTETNDNGNSNLACFIRTLLLMWPKNGRNGKRNTVNTAQTHTHNALHALLTLKCQTLSIGHIQIWDLQKRPKYLNWERFMCLKLCKILKWKLHENKKTKNRLFGILDEKTVKSSYMFVFCQWRNVRTWFGAAILWLFLLLPWIRIAKEK